jgi:hypothetical protein
MSTRYKVDKCGNPGIGIDKLESNVQNLLINNFFPLLVKNRNSGNLVKRIDDIEDEITLLNRDLKSENNKEKRVLDLYLDGDLDKGIYKERLEGIKKEQEKINTKIQDLQVEKLRVESIIKSENDLQSIARTYRKEGIDRDTIRKIINHIVITPAPEINLCDNTRDKVIKVDLHIGEQVFGFYIGQRSENIKLVNEPTEKTLNVFQAINFVNDYKDQN